MVNRRVAYGVRRALSMSAEPFILHEYREEGYGWVLEQTAQINGFLFIT